MPSASVGSGLVVDLFVFVVVVDEFLFDEFRLVDILGDEVTADEQHHKADQQHRNATNSADDEPLLVGFGSG